MGPMKYPQKKISDPRNTHEKKLRTHEGTVARCHEAHETHDGTRLTEFSKLVKSITSYLVSVKLVSFNIMNINIEQIQNGAIIGAKG